MTLDPSRCALIIQDMQNDVMMDGGAFAFSGSPQHARELTANSTRAWCRSVPTNVSVSRRCFNSLTASPAPNEH
jgi:nicotinamidase-related amidase